MTEPTSEARSIKYAIRGLRRHTKSIHDQTFPGDHPGPRKWLNIIFGLLNTAELRLAELGSGDTAVLLRQASQLTGAAYHYLTVCMGVGLDELPYPVIIPLQRLLDQLEFQNDFFFRAKLEANYEIQSFEEKTVAGIKNPHPSLTTAIQRINWPLIRITVPSRAFSIIPHFAIVGHEVGHALISRIDWRYVFDPSADSELQSRIESRLQKINERGGKIAFSADVLKRHTRDVYMNWFSEIASDAIGFYLMGPALFFALQEFLLISSSSYGISESHPANDIRLKFLHKRVVDGGAQSFAASFKASTGRDLTTNFNNHALAPTPSSDKIFTDMLRSIDRADSVIVSAVIAELHETLLKCDDGIYSSVRDFFEKNFVDLIYSPARFQHDVETHLAPLLYAVPPIEEDRGGAGASPTEFASIINVGWIVLLCKLEEMHLDSSVGMDRRVEILQGLILKGVELSEARRHWTMEFDQ
jgi:hypothetical protein